MMPSEMVEHFIVAPPHFLRAQVSAKKFNNDNAHYWYQNANWRKSIPM